MRTTVDIQRDANQAITDLRFVSIYEPNDQRLMTLARDVLDLLPIVEAAAKMRDALAEALIVIGENDSLWPNGRSAADAVASITAYDAAIAGRSGT